MHISQRKSNILTPLNDTINEINYYIFEKSEDLTKQYRSSNEIDKTTDKVKQETYISSRIFIYFKFYLISKPIFETKIRKANYAAKEHKHTLGMCNETRLLIMHQRDRVIKAEIVITMAIQKYLSTGQV